MNTTSITLPGVVTAEGGLEMSQPVPLPPGPVEVTVTVVALPKEDSWAVLQRIWTERRASGEQGRTKEQIDADLQELRDELEEHARSLERLQEDTVLPQSRRVKVSEMITSTEGG